MASQKIGRYEIVSELGQGGMAIVYLARDPFMNRQIALKVLPRQFTFDPQFRVRFKREAEAVASLEHPAIVPVYDYGEHDEQPFIVMRYMPGGTLQEKIGKPEARTGLVHILQRVGQALDEAHSRGIIHRDLKPSNVLFDAWGEAYLSDFGIAKLAESTGTYSGSMMLGTPAYMSPEQARGERNIDGRSDIYALGVLLFELLSGRKPYEADTPMGMAVKHVTEPVPSILAAKPDLPREYEAVIAKALAKNRDDRYQSAAELANAVNQVVGGASTVLPPTPTVQPEVTQVSTAEPPRAAPRTQPLAAESPQVEAAGTVAAAKGALAEVAALESPATMASSAVATPVPAAVRRPPRLAVGMVIGIAVLAILALGGGAIVFALINNQPTPTPTLTLTLAPTAAPPTFTAVVVPASETPAPSATPKPSNTTAPTEAPSASSAPSDTPTQTATATRTRAPTAAVTVAPPTATQQPSGCLALPADQQADCFVQATQEEAARRTQTVIDLTAGAPTEEPSP